MTTWEFWLHGCDHTSPNVPNPIKTPELNVLGKSSARLSDLMGSPHAAPLVFFTYQKKIHRTKSENYHKWSESAYWCSRVWKNFWLHHWRFRKRENASLLWLGKNNGKLHAAQRNLWVINFQGNMTCCVSPQLELNASKLTWLEFISFIMFLQIVTRYDGYTTSWCYTATLEEIEYK